MSKLRIEHFGPIQQIELTINRKFCVLIGEQATGKSTIVKCIFFFKDLITNFDDLLFAHPNLTRSTNGGILLNEFYQKVRQDFIKSFGKHNQQSDFKISYIYDNGRKAIIECLNEEVTFHFDKDTEKDILDLIFESAKAVENEQDEKKAMSMVPLYTFLLYSLFEKYSRPIFIPACRATFDASTSLSFKHIKTEDMFNESMMRNIMYYKFFTDVFSKNDIYKRYKNKNENISKQVILKNVNLFEKIKKRIIKGDFVWDKSEEQPEITLESGIKIPLEFGSSGQQESIWILNFLTMILYDAGKSFVVIEEPEAHLYPSAQLDLVKLIVQVANITDSQIIVTTHSPYILSAFNLLAYSGKKEKYVDEGIIEKPFRIMPSTLDAYKLKAGECKRIYDTINLVDADEIDEASDYINDQMDAIYSKYTEE